MKFSLNLFLFPLIQRFQATRRFTIYVKALEGFPGGSVVKNPPASAGDMGSICGSGRPLGEGNGNPLQYSCLENLMDLPGGL